MAFHILTFQSRHPLFFLPPPSSTIFPPLPNFPTFTIHPQLTVGGLCPWQLDVAALQKELDKSQSVFSGNPSVWLKDLASYLNYKLQAPPSEPTLSQHTHG